MSNMDPNEKPGMNSGDHEGQIRLNVAL
jgi:hypothetical protein